MANASTSWTAGADFDSRACVDTNIVVYAHDPSDRLKHAKAVALIEQLSNEGRLVLGAQVFNEFSSVMMRRNRTLTLRPDEVATILREMEAIAEVVPITPSITFRALDAMPRHGLSFWDALIWAAAKENGVEVVYTEDFQHGRDVEGVRIVNPFAAT